MPSDSILAVVAASCGFAGLLWIVLDCLLHMGRRWYSPVSVALCISASIVFLDMPLLVSKVPVLQTHMWLTISLLTVSGLLFIAAALNLGEMKDAEKPRNDKIKIPLR